VIFSERLFEEVYMSYNLFIDDIRDPQDIDLYSGFNEDFWKKTKIARSYEDAIFILSKNGIPDVLMIDPFFENLSGELSALDAFWSVELVKVMDDLLPLDDLVEKVIDIAGDDTLPYPENFKYYLHGNCSETNVYKLLEKALEDFMVELKILRKYAVANLAVEKDTKFKEIKDSPVFTEDCPEDVKTFNSLSLEDRIFCAKESIMWDLSSPLISYKKGKKQIAIFPFWKRKLFFKFEYLTDIYSPLNVSMKKYVLDDMRTGDFSCWQRCIKEHSDEVEFWSNPAYSKSTIFIECPFDELLKTVSNYLDKHCYRTEDKEKCSLWEASWSRYAEEEDCVYATIYIAGQDVTIIGAGVTITILDIPSLISYGEYKDHLDHTIPKCLLEYFNIIPNAVQISFNRNCSIPYSDGLKFLDGLCRFVGESGYKSILYYLNNDLLKIKSDPSLSVDEKFEKLCSYILDLANDDDLSKYNEVVEKKYSGLLSNFTPKSKQFLLTAYWQVDIYRNLSSSIVDYTPITVLLTKVVETEIENKIWGPFKRFYLSSNYIEKDATKDLNDNDLKRYMKFILDKSNKIKTPELGSTMYFISTILNSKKRAEWSLLVQSFRDFCLTLNKDAQLFIKNELPELLVKITTKYRNGSVHTQSIAKETALEYISIIEDQKEGIMVKISNIHP
jgi:hypothetical protein